MLLYPERGLALNGTAASILKLCDGERTLDGIVVELHQQYVDRSGDEVRAVVHHVTSAAAGQGAAREFCDLLLVAAGRYAGLLRSPQFALDASR